MFIEYHILQNFPPNNLNRDDTGAPKECDFGGFRRARISSQCLKRSIRLSEGFKKAINASPTHRTKNNLNRLKQALENHGVLSADVRDAASRAVLSSLIGEVNEEGKTSVLFFGGGPEFERLAEIMDEEWSEDYLKPAQEINTIRSDDSLDDKEKDKKLKKPTKKLEKFAKKVKKTFEKEFGEAVIPVDVAMFGRMLANSPKLNVDAASQVAHAISTNRVSMEFDYYTAVDDLNPEEETGAGMIGTTGFNSSCFYRYGVIDARQLIDNLNGDKEQTIAGIKGFLQGSIEAIPTGKQNSFAAHTPPSFIGLTVRNEGQPISLANAFQKPVRPQSGVSLVDGSIEALNSHFANMTKMYGKQGLWSGVVVENGQDTNGTWDNTFDSVTELLGAVYDQVNTGMEA